MAEKTNGKGLSGTLGGCLGMAGAVALSFGCAVCWGAFMMPANVFLPGADPLGSMLCFGLGSLAMFIFAWCYHVMTKRLPGAGGAYELAKKMFGGDNGFLIAWFLCLTCVTVLWANATSLTLLSRCLFGDAMQFGFHYTLAGSDVYFGEVLLSLAAIALGAAVTLAGRRFAANLQTLAAAVRADARLKDLPVYAITADVESQKGYGELGFTGMLLKPVTIEKLKGLLC